MESESHSNLSIALGGHHVELSLLHSRLSHLAIYQSLCVENKPYEDETLMCLYTRLRPGDVFIDVGAHIGYFSVWASRFVGSGKVYAIEPEKSNYELLKQTLVKNDCRNVATFRAAVAEHDGDVPFYLNIDNDGGHSLWDCSQHEFNQKTKLAPVSVLVPCVTLDTFCTRKKTGQIRMVKIDTEGAELSVLKGASELLSMSAIDYVVCEINDFGLGMMGSTRTELKEFMNSKGYRIVHSDQHEEPFVFNVMFAREGL